MDELAEAAELAMRGRREDANHGSHAFAMGAAKSLIPGSRFAGWALVQGARLISALPAGVSRALAKLNSRGVRLHDSMHVKDYSALQAVDH